MSFDKTLDFSGPVPSVPGNNVNLAQNKLGQGFSIPYSEWPGSPRESLGGNVFKASRSFRVPWNNRWTFCAGMVGYPSLQQDSQGQFWISRVIPQGYHATDFDFSGDGSRRFLWANGVTSIEPLGKIIGYDKDKVAQYTDAKITVEFEQLSYKIISDSLAFTQATNFQQQILDLLSQPTVVGFFPPGLSDIFSLPAVAPVGEPALTFGGDGISEANIFRYVTKFQQPTAEYLTLPFGAMSWVQPGGSIPIPGTIGKVISATEVTYIWHQVPNIPQAVRYAIGTVNQKDFGGYPRGTLLLTSVDVKPYRWWFNSRVYDITYKMKFFSPVDGGIAKDTKLDKNFIPVNEIPGHNHFLRFKLADDGVAVLKSPGTNQLLIPGQDYTPSGVPTYQMISNDGSRPFKNPNSNNQNNASGTGATVYNYSDFSNLFQPTAPVVPSE